MRSASSRLKMFRLPRIGRLRQGLEVGGDGRVEDDELGPVLLECDRLHARGCRDRASRRPRRTTGVLGDDLDRPLARSIHSSRPALTTDEADRRRSARLTSKADRRSWSGRPLGRRRAANRHGASSRRGRSSLHAAIGLGRTEPPHLEIGVGDPTDHSPGSRPPWSAARCPGPAGRHRGAGRCPC